MKARTPTQEATGKRFGRLLVLVVHPGKPPKCYAHAECRCDCGRIITAKVSALRACSTQSCGCLRLERALEANTKHGMARKTGTSPEFHVWVALNQRCYNPNVSGWHNYGGRGIKVCDRWRDSFEAFLEDMGPRTSPDLSIERIDNNEGYSKENCKWAKKSEQVRNMRKNRWIEFGGERLIIEDWAKRVGICTPSLRKRLRAWTTEKALTTPAPK